MMSFVDKYKTFLSKVSQAAADSLEHEVANEVRATMIIKPLTRYIPTMPALWQWIAEGWRRGAWGIGTKSGQK